MKTHKLIENYRIRAVYGSNETNGVFLKVSYELKEDGSDVGEPMEFYTGSVFLFLRINYSWFSAIRQFCCPKLKTFRPAYVPHYILVWLFYNHVKHNFTWWYNRCKEFG